MVFASSVVAIDSTGWDQHTEGQQFYGAMYTWNSAKSKRLFEPYVFVKAQERAIDERGNAGDALIATAGFRMVGPFTKRVDYNVEAATQSGHNAGDEHQAWAVHVGGGTTFPDMAWRPRLGVDFDAASGDREAKDGKRHTFDVLYGTNHAKFGLLDNIAWRNMEHVGVIVTMTPAKTLKTTTGWHRNWVRELADGYYQGGGGKTKTSKTGEHLLGDTVDVQLSIDVAKHLNVQFGAGYMFAGGYQRFGVGRENAFTQFLMWRVVF
jgi:hypothetical protein